MAGAGLIAIKRRIKSVVNTKKITKAMGLVATSKLRRSREKLALNEQYYSSFNEVMKEILNNSIERSIYTHGNKSDKKLYVVFTSDTGLCGGFNGTVVNKTIDSIGADKDNSLIMVVGQKGKNYFNRLNFETVAEYVEVPDFPTTKDATTIARHALELFEKGEVGEVNVVFTKFVSAVRLVTDTKKVLPLSYENVDVNEIVTFEPDLSDIIKDSIELYLKEEVLYCMLNSKASEQSSRMNAMDGATKNANELLDKYNLLYNRLRQSSITSEISEIVGGAAAQE